VRLTLGGDLVEGPAIAVEHRGLVREVLLEAGRPKSEPAPGSMEYQALHPDWVWKPSED
jgi:hypothetical protein